MKNNQTITIKGYEFEVLKAKTVAGGVKMHEYRSACHDSLDECYKKCSEDKWDAYFRCKRLCKEIGGQNYRIPSNNGWSFTFAFQLPDGPIVYITKDHDYIIL